MLGIAQGGLGKPSQTALLPADFDNQQVEVAGFVTRAALPVLEADTSSSDSEQAPAETYQQNDLEAESIRKLDQDPGRSILPLPKLGIRIGASMDQCPRQTRLTPSTLLCASSIMENVYAFGAEYARHKFMAIWNIRSASLPAEQRNCCHVQHKAGKYRSMARSGWDTLGRSACGCTAKFAATHACLAHSRRSSWRIFAISQGDAALLAAMILGERSLLEQNVKLDFQRTGSYHLLVVSGMGVAIFAFSVFWLARLLRVPDAVATIASSILVGLYVSVTALGVPVQRATFTCVVYMLAPLLYRERNPLNALGVAALAALVMDPKALFNAGFQMSFLAVFTIAGIVGPIMDRAGVLPKSASAHRFHELRPASSPKTGAVPNWLAHDAGTTGTPVASMGIALTCDWRTQARGENR